MRHDTQGQFGAVMNCEYRKASIPGTHKPYPLFDIVGHGGPIVTGFH